MKLIYAIIHEKDSENVIESLTSRGFTMIRMTSTGGFLRYGNVTLLIGAEPEGVQEVITVLKDHCSSIAPNQHAATIFVLDMPIYSKR